MGRNAISKLILLFRVMSVLQHRPMRVPDACFRRLDELLCFWGNGGARIRFRALQLPWDSGRLHAPHFQSYYQAAHLQHVVEWFIEQYTDPLTHMLARPDKPHELLGLCGP
ncbi:hypothetical protein NDU88_002167 [Pleurodeles waltl]|uniref:Secreted protein n=1 Tax=Pleurodeles waltl TaxID=8319 RepID=A0AAV7MUW3_PLEWA|nr:hypothetical protein NDU88_002167 [Pleurodeles waltl]